MITSRLVLKSVEVLSSQPGAFNTLNVSKGTDDDYLAIIETGVHIITENAPSFNNPREREGGVRGSIRRDEPLPFRSVPRDHHQVSLKRVWCNLLLADTTGDPLLRKMSYSV